MISGIGGPASARTGQAGPGRGRVDPKGAGASAGERDSDTPGRALAAVELVRSRTAEGRRPGHSAAFITQLAALHLGAAPEGERRVRRAPESVARRAAGHYRATGALTSAIEPGFLVRRDA